MRKMMSFELEAEEAARLKRFAQAAGTFKTRVIRMALQEFIAKALRESPSVRERFERYTAEDLARALPPNCRHLRVVK